MINPSCTEKMSFRDPVVEKHPTFLKHPVIFDVVANHGCVIESGRGANNIRSHGINQRDGCGLYTWTSE